MNKTILLCIFGVLVLSVIAGCLAASGSLGGFFASDSGSDNNGPPAEPPVPNPVELVGPSLRLDGTPTGVLIGDFFPDPEGDVAVALDDKPRVALFENDGSGGFPVLPDLEFTLSSTPFAMARLPDENGCETLVVATKKTLEVIRPCRDEQPVIHTLKERENNRSIAVGDFNGDKLWDVAVTSPGSSSNFVEIFRGTEDGINDVDEVLSVNEPVALTSANFDNDELGRWDLVVLTDEPKEAVLYESVGDFSFERLARVEILDAKDDDNAALVSRDALDPADLDAKSRFPTRTDELDDDRHPDFAVARRVAIIKIVVHETECDEEHRLTMTRPIRPTGPTGKSPHSPQLIRLPGGEDKPLCWDLVALDSRSGIDESQTQRSFVIARYTDTGKKCLQAGDEVPLPVPGRAVALSVGHLNEDEHEDIVVVSEEPSLLSVLLSNPVHEHVKPFFSRNGMKVGENPPPSGLRGLDFGFASAGEYDPFLVTKGKGGKEVLVIFLDEKRSRMIEPPERHILQKQFEFDELVVADLDGMYGDDVILVSEEGTVSILWSRQGRRFFLVEGFLDLSSRPGADDSEPFELRIPITGDVDRDGFPDLLIPARNSSDEDFIAVVMHPGVDFVPERDVHFVPTLDGPRYQTLADVDGDGVEDLIVACEGQSPNGNKVHILRGDPDEPSGFSEFAPRCILPGFEVKVDACGGCDPKDPHCDDKPEVEYVTTDAELRAPGEPVKFILTSGDKNVFVYTNSETEPGTFDGPFHVHTGVDPETLFVADIFGRGNPDFVMVDEDGSDRDRFIVWEFVSDEDGPPQWTAHPVDLSDAPAEFKVFGGPDGRLLALTIRGSTNFALWEFSESNRDGLKPLDPIVVEGQQSGTPMGSDLSELVDGKRYWATIVEDRDPEANQAAVDIVSIDAVITADDLRRMGSAVGGFPSRRLRFEDDRDLVGVVWGSFGGSAADLLVAYVAREADGAERSHFAVYHDLGMKLPWIRFFRRPEGQSDPALEEFDPGLEEFDPALEFDPDLEVPIPGTLVDLRKVRAKTGDRVLIATGTNVYLLDPSNGEEPGDLGSPLDPDASILQIVPFFRDSTKIAVVNETTIRIATMQGDELRLESGGPVLEDSMGTTLEDAVVGCRDVNRDYMDDIVVVAPGKPLRVFLAPAWREVPSELSFTFDRQVDLVDLAFLDANGDGLVDVCVGTEDGFVLVFYGNGTGEFPEFSEAFAGPDLEAVRAANLVGDDKEEVLASVGNPGFVALVAE